MPTLTGRPVVAIFGAALRADGTPSRALLRRVDAALACGRQLDRPLYWPSGGGPSGSGPSGGGCGGVTEAAAMAARLRAGGVAAQDILPDPDSADTVASVRAVRRLVGPGGGPVRVATDRYHLPRCLVLLWLAGVPARPAPPPPEPAARAWCRRWYWRLREVPALPWDALTVLALRLRGRL